MPLRLQKRTAPYLHLLNGYNSSTLLLISCVACCCDCRCRQSQSGCYPPSHSYLLDVKKVVSFNLANNVNACVCRQVNENVRSMLALVPLQCQRYEHIGENMLHEAIHKRDLQTSQREKWYQCIHSTQCMSNPEYSRRKPSSTYVCVCVCGVWVYAVCEPQDMNVRVECGCTRANAISHCVRVSANGCLVWVPPDLAANVY